MYVWGKRMCPDVLQGSLWTCMGGEGVPAQITPPQKKKNYIQLWEKEGEGGRMIYTRVYSSVKFRLMWAEFLLMVSPLVKPRSRGKKIGVIIRLEILWVSKLLFCLWKICWWTFLLKQKKKIWPLDALSPLCLIIVRLLMNETRFS